MMSLIEVPYTPDEKAHISMNATTNKLQKGRKSYNCFLLFIGGLATNIRIPIEDTLADVYRLDTATHEWLELASMNIGRSDHAAAIMDEDNIVVLGGSGQNGNLLASVEKYSICKMPGITRITLQKLENWQLLVVQKDKFLSVVEIQMLIADQKIFICMNQRMTNGYQ